MEIPDSLVDWSRAQFALTAIYHWLFVPLTLGLGVIMALMETIHVKTGDAKWRRTARFWQRVFGINFAIGVASGIILEFEFGTNWSNYSWFVGDIFGAPLAIEGIFAFFMEATFVALMFFGWDKVGRKTHLASTWLVAAGATLSALWILVANAWMQHPVGMRFNPDAVRNEMADFGALALSPVAINKFLHTVASAWVLGAVVVLGISAWYLLKKRETVFAIDSMKVAAVVGLAGTLATLQTGDGSACLVASTQPMKLAAMEGLREGGRGAGLTAIGILRTEAKPGGSEPWFSWEITFPKMLSLLATRRLDGFVPGVRDILNGGHENVRGVRELSAEEKIRRGKLAIAALAEYRKARAGKDEAGAIAAKVRLEENFPYFGYGYFNSPGELVPNVPLVFYAFRLMVALGLWFLLLFPMALFLAREGRVAETRWFLRLAVVSIPLAYLASQAGWIVAEAGRQPWAIQDMLPLRAAVSNIETGSVQVTFFLFLALFAVLLAAGLRIMLKQIQAGPASTEDGDGH
ncbi:MAG: cytochrome ubiquinol oxidase subunit I [Puniceicoccales bacterium]|jgi:cytochrome d ubiquinol oxidase subunit I|nr:cytochrome ubiquinol oxidase subunit I [Puniceicoccales bacterium]